MNEKLSSLSLERFIEAQELMYLPPDGIGYVHLRSSAYFDHNLRQRLVLS